MVADRQNIPLTETFTSPSPADRYSVYQGVTTGSNFGQVPGDNVPFGLSTQQHIDIRTFNSPTAAIPEGWTVTGTATFTTGPQAAFNHWQGLNASLPSGITTFTSAARSLDLTPIAGAKIILALPNFNLPSISTSGSSLILSDGTSTATLPFSTSTTALINGNSTATWPLSAVSGIDLTTVTQVQLVINTTAATSFYAMALRLVGPQWVLSGLGFDTWNGWFKQPVPPNGASTAIPGNQMLPTLWRSAMVSGVDDPRPVNGEFGVLFNTGSQTQTNSFTLYMREQSQAAFLTQLDLEGDTQAQLTGKPQPATGVSEYSPLPIGQLDQFSVGTLNDKQMIDLERTSNPVYSSWISFMIQWGTNPLVQINNSSNATSGNNGYQYTPSALANNTTYLAIFNLTDTVARAQIWTLDQSTLALDHPLFDSTVIPDSYAFPRRAGRIGFTATLADGDASIRGIRPRSLMFAEYRSKPLHSLTPVSGTRLYAQTSPDIPLFTNWMPLSDISGRLPLLSVDQQRFVRPRTNASSILVSVTTPSTGSPAQGVISNVLTPPNDPVSGITDFRHLDIEFAVWMPHEAVNSIAGPVLTVALVSANGNSIPVPLPRLIPDQWFEIDINQPVLPPHPISGLYQLALYYNGTVAADWWLDEATVFERAVNWSARSVVNDPWGSNYAPWTPFYDQLNSDTGGVKFSPMGSELQVRAQALKQNAVIVSAPKLIPQYAELGRLVWPEDVPSTPSPPTAAMTISNTGRTFTFNGTSSSGPNGVGNYYWVFGDGTYGSGPVITHTYPSWVASGTQYTATLTVIDRSSQAASSPPQQITLP